MKSLLIINHSYPIERKEGSFIVRDGISSYAVGITAHLKEFLDITVISPGSGVSFTHEGVHYLSWGNQSRSLNKAGNMDFWLKIMKYISVNRFDIILVNSAATVFLSFVSDILAAHCIGLFHDTYPGKYKFYFNMAREVWLKCSKALDLALSANSDGCERLIGKYKYDPRKVHCVGAGVAIDHYPFSAAKEDRVLFIGRFVRSKQVVELLQAFRPWLKEHPSARLVLIGQGIFYDALKEYVSRHEIRGQVEIYSGLTDNEKIRELQKAKIYVSLSQIEGFGLPVVEGMSCGAVPVISDIPAHRFVFQGRKVGFLVKDADELIAKVSLLFKNDEMRQEMAARGKALVEEMWTWEKTKERFERALSFLQDKKLTFFARRIKRPVKMRILKFFSYLFYFFVFRMTLFKSANDGS